MAVKLLSPTKTQMEAIQAYLNLDSGEVADAFMKSLERGVGYIEQYNRPVALGSGCKRLSMAMPGEAGLQAILFVPLESSGLVLKIERPHVNGAHPIVVCVHALEDFDALVRESGKAYGEKMMGELIERLGSIMSHDEVVSCVQETLSESDLGPLFRAHRSASVLMDAIEAEPSKPARSFLPRRG